MQAQLIKAPILLAATVLAISSAAATPNEAGSGVLGIANLQKVADQIRHFKPKDEFDAPPNASILTGQAF